MALRTPKDLNERQSQLEARARGVHERRREIASDAAGVIGEAGHQEIPKLPLMEAVARLRAAAKMAKTDTTIAKAYGFRERVRLALRRFFGGK